MTVRLVCGNCGRIELFESFEAAADAGWDEPLTYGYTACSECPGVSVYLPILYCQEAREARTVAMREEKMKKAAAATMEFHPRFLDNTVGPSGVWMPRPG